MEIFDEINKKLSASATPALPEANFKYNTDLARYYRVREFILSKDSYIRIFMILATKKITWYKELEKRFDIHHSHIDTFFEKMKDEGIILFQPLFKVDSILFEAVIKQNSAKFYEQRDIIKVYTLVHEGFILFEKMLDEIINYMADKPSLRIYISQIQDKVKSHNEQLNKIMHEENTLRTRNIIYPCGLVEEKETIKTKTFNKNLIIEVKKFYDTLKIENKFMRLIKNG